MHRWLFVAGTRPALPALARADLPIERVAPSSPDPRITQFDDDDVEIVDAAAGPDAPLAVFLPGTDGRPTNVLPLPQVVAAQGDRIIGLAYDDEPSVSKVCLRDPIPPARRAFAGRACSATARRRSPMPRTRASCRA